MRPNEARQVFEIKPSTPVRFTDVFSVIVSQFAWHPKHDDKPLAEFRALPAKAKDQIVEVLSSAPKPKAAKARFDFTLDAVDFADSSPEVQRKNQAKVYTSHNADKPSVRQPTAEQLKAMREFGLSCPPRLMALDGTITEGIASVVPCGENNVGQCQNGQCRYQRVESTPYVECESCKRRNRY